MSTTTIEAKAEVSFETMAKVARILILYSRFDRYESDEALAQFSRIPVETLKGFLSDQGEKNLCCLSGRNWERLLGVCEVSYSPLIEVVSRIEGREVGDVSKIISGFFREATRRHQAHYDQVPSKTIESATCGMTY